MNYKPIIALKLTEVVNKSPDLSFGQILYSIFRKKNLENRPFEGSKETKWLLEMNDEDFLRAIENHTRNEE
jgi:hypothetical protein